MDKINVTAQQRRNAESALYDMWPSIPEENVNLDDWVSRGKVKKPDCKTVACFGGWCAVWPPFIAQGVYALHSGCPAFHGSPLALAPWAWLTSREVSKVLFGVEHMFDTLHQDEGALSDKEIVTRRLQKLINDSVVVG